MTDPAEDQPLLNRSWMDNAPYLGALVRAQQATYWLCAWGAKVQRLQIKGGRVQMEIDGPVECSLPRSRLLFGGEDYRAIYLYDCQVLWRQPEPEEEGPDV